MTLQLVPSQCSASVCARSLVVKLPTAQTSLAEVAATAYKLLSPADPGLGLGMILQLAPSQCMTNVVWSRRTPLVPLPTAHASDEEMATMPLSTFSRLFVFGLGTIVQAAPFQCSIK